MKFGLEEEVYNKIKSIVKKYPYHFRIFGSRARGDFKNYSDIDIAIFENIEYEEEYQIRNDFDLLDIPYTIDLVFINTNTKQGLLYSINKEGVDII